MAGTPGFRLYAHGRSNQQKEGAGLDSEDGNVGDSMNHHSGEYREDEEIHTGTGIAFEPLDNQAHLGERTEEQEQRANHAIIEKDI